jgi:dTDP-glucose 4,6-dehydratase
MTRTVLVTGGAGFIGSNFCHYWKNRFSADRLICLDALTYAGNMENLKTLLAEPGFVFVKGSINDGTVVKKVFTDFDPTLVFHFAAESHVDRSIEDPAVFLETNVAGTGVLLENALRHWSPDTADRRFIHVSTDEVYGTLGPDDPPFNEQTPYAPNSPYAASKAGADHLVRSYHRTYGLPCITTNSSNNYGPFQFPEKLIPLMINNLVHEKALPVYGDGQNVRDWLFVADHCRALHTIALQGAVGETYVIGAGCEKKNIDLVYALCDLVDTQLGRHPGQSRALIQFVEDRAGHDRRYAIDAGKLESQLGWRPQRTFDRGLAETVRWYLDHTEWVAQVTSGAYRRYYEKMYGTRKILSS